LYQTGEFQLVAVTRASRCKRRTCRVNVRHECCTN